MRAGIINQRRTDLDAIRGFAMLLGIALHASLSFLPLPWPVHDSQPSTPLLFLFPIVHGFRMPLFFLLSGYFTMLVCSRRGLADLLAQRFKRILLPLVIAAATIVPLDRLILQRVLLEVSPEPAVAEILSSDTAAVRRRLATPGAVAVKDPFWGLTPLAWATMHGDPAVVSGLLDAGADCNERDQQENTPLHLAALFGRDRVGRVLVERGANPLAENAVGRIPAALFNFSADRISEYASLIGLKPLLVDDVLSGRQRLHEFLPRGPNAEGSLGDSLDRVTLAWSGLLASERLRVQFGGASLHLFYTNILDHLWFLWFLCWLVAIFAILARCGLLPSGDVGRWLIAASCLPQAVMNGSAAGFYGPETSLGLLPLPHVLGFYACFFFYGVAAFRAEGLDTRIGRRWPLLLPAAAIVLVAGIVTLNDRLLAIVLQPAYAWAMSLGLIGLFCRLFPHPHRGVSWLADASYWMYLVHVPLVMLLQIWIRRFSLQPELKFLIILAVTTAVLLVTYRYGVRYTAVGSLLNGPRRPKLAVE